MDSIVVPVLVPNNNNKASGFYFDINQQQIDSLNTWKDRLLQEGTIADFNKYDDLYLLRFLRARKFDIEKTNLMFTNFMKWRTENNVDEIEVKRILKSSIFIIFFHVF